VSFHTQPGVEEFKLNVNTSSPPLPSPPSCPTSKETTRSIAITKIAPKSQRRTRAATRNQTKQDSATREIASTSEKVYQIEIDIEAEKAKKAEKEFNKMTAEDRAVNSAYLNSAPKMRKREIKYELKNTKKK
jgi:hypothetical protein